MCRHLQSGVHYSEIEKRIACINSLFREGLSLGAYKKMKESVLNQIAVSHRPVYANKFIY